MFEKLSDPINRGRRRELSCRNHKNRKLNTNQNIARVNHEGTCFDYFAHSYPAMRPGLEAAGQ